MFNTLAGVTFHLIKDNQCGTQGNVLQFYLMSLPNQNLSAYLANRTEQNQKQPRMAFLKMLSLIPFQTHFFIIF